MCKFSPQESQSDVSGDLQRMISLVVGSYFGMSPLLLPGLEPSSPGTLTVLTRVRCLSLKPDMDREECSHPDSRISAKVQSWELGLSRVLRPDHPELRHVSSLHYRLRYQSRPWFLPVFATLRVGGRESAPCEAGGVRPPFLTSTQIPELEFQNNSWS